MVDAKNRLDCSRNFSGLAQHYSVSAAAGEKRLCMEQCGLGLLRLLRLPVLECQPDQILAETRDCLAEAAVEV